MSRETEQIVVLDDEPSYAEMISCMLREEGFATLMFTSPQEAIEHIRRKGCTLLVADYKMPVLGGTDFLLQLRETHPRLPVIVISGHMNTRDLLSVANIGVTMVLEKPFSKDALVEQVRMFASPVQTQAAAAPGPLASVKQKAKGADSPQNPYPTQGLRCSQASSAARSFLQELWDTLREHKGANISLPLGAELELIVSDVERWFSLASPALRLSPAMLGTGSGPMNDTGNLALLDARYASGDIGADIARLRSRLPVKMPLLVIRRADNAGADGGLPLVPMPPLRGRPEDVATYTHSILDRMGAAGQLLPDAARLLLNYPWPGNYYELMGALRRAVLGSAGDKIDALVVSSALAEGHGSAPAGSTYVNLAAYLSEEQARWFDKEACMDWDSAEKAAGLPRGTLDRSLPLYQQHLVFPELLRGES